MTFKIHCTLSDGSDDFIIITRDTIEEIREETDAFVLRVSGINPWSEEIK